MAIFNGEQFLTQHLDSLAAQTNACCGCPNASPVALRCCQPPLSASKLPISGEPLLTEKNTYKQKHWQKVSAVND